jgi:hypothetical protein
MNDEVRLSNESLKGIERAVCRGVIHAVCWILLVAAILGAGLYVGIMVVMNWGT